MRRGGQHIGYQVVQRRGVALQVGREVQSLAAAHNGDAVVAQRAGNQHLIARSALRAAQLYARGQRAHAARIDEHAIAMAAVHHLRVASHQRHAGLARHLGHRGADAAQIIDGKTLFQNEPAAEVQRARAACGHVVHRAAHGQTPDVAAGEEVGRHHEAVRGERQALARRRRGQHRRVIAAQQLVARIGREEHLIDDALHHRAAAAVSQHHRRIHNLSSPRFGCLQLIPMFHVKHLRRGMLRRRSPTRRVASQRCPPPSRGSAQALHADQTRTGSGGRCHVCADKRHERAHTNPTARPERTAQTGSNSKPPTPAFARLCVCASAAGHPHRCGPPRASRTPPARKPRTASRSRRSPLVRRPVALTPCALPTSTERGPWWSRQGGRSSRPSCPG